MKTQAKVTREVLLSHPALQLRRPPTTDPWPVIVSYMPTAPDAVVVIYNTNGVTEGDIQRTGEVLERPGVQIRVRAKTSDPAEFKICDIVEALDQQWAGGVVEVEGVMYYVSSFKRTTSIIDMGEETAATGGGRRSFVVNYLVNYRKL